MARSLWLVRTKVSWRCPTPLVAVRADGEGEAVAKGFEAAKGWDKCDMGAFKAEDFKAVPLLGPKEEARIIPWDSIRG